jgi:hypothetical protein
MNKKEVLGFILMAPLVLLILLALGALMFNIPELGIALVIIGMFIYGLYLISEGK